MPKRDCHLPHPNRNLKWTVFLDIWTNSFQLNVRVVWISDLTLLRPTVRQLGHEAVKLYLVLCTMWLMEYQNEHLSPSPSNYCCHNNLSWKKQNQVQLTHSMMSQHSRRSLLSNTAPFHYHLFQPAKIGVKYDVNNVR
jgi:hypothetical protein